MADNLTPEPVPPDSSEICSRKDCFKSGRWRIQKKIYCEEHTVLAEWLPGVPKSWTGPRGKKNQLKLPFPEATDGKAQASGEDRNERQGKEDAGGDASGRTDFSGGNRQGGIPIDGAKIDDQRKFMVEELAPVSREDEMGQTDWSRPVPEAPDRDREEGNEAPPWDDEEDEEGHSGDCPDYYEDDHDFKRDARRNADF